MITIESDTGLKLRLGNRVAVEVRPMNGWRYSAKRSEFARAFTNRMKYQTFVYFCGPIVRPNEDDREGITRRVKHRPRLGNITIGCQTFSGIHYEALKAWALGEPR